MPDLTLSADMDALLASANDAAARTELGLTALATTTPGTGVATALAVNIGSAGAPILFNGAAGTPTSLVGTNITGTAAGLTAGVASAVAVGGISGLGTGVGTALAVNVGSAGAPVLFNGAGGTPSSLVGTNITGTAAGLTAGTASAVAVGGISGLGTGVGTFLATPSGANLATALTTALPATKGGTGLTALGTGVATALGVNANAGGGLIVLADPGADRIPFWDDSAGAFVFLTVGSGLTITDTTITASGAGATAVTAASTAAGAGLFWVSGGADRSATATDTITTINATNANVTNLLPVSNDGAAIGASGTAFSDLFLASGAVINFNAGNLTLTHSAGVLTSNGAYVGTTGTFGSTTSLLLGTAGSAVGNVGFRNATSGTITVAPTTGALGTVTQTLQAVTGTILCTGGTDVPVADGGTGLSSGTSGGVLAFTASGTLASSGALAANAIVIGGGAGVVPSTTTTGAGVLTALATAPNAAGGLVTVSTGTINAPTITYTVEPGADDTAYGDRIAGILAGDTIAQWDLVYLDSTSGRWELADSDAVATAGGVLLGLAVASGTDGGALTVLVRGIVRNDGWTWASAGLKLYASLTPGGITVTRPSATDDVIRPIADTLSDDCIWFNPGQFWETHV